MGATLSQEQLNEYREVVKDRLSDEAIAFLYSKFMKAAPNGRMTPVLFKRYIEQTGVYKNEVIAELEQNSANQVATFGTRAWNLLARSKNVVNFRSWNANTVGNNNNNNNNKNLNSRAYSARTLSSTDDLYLHLFRGYDIDGDGVITFKEFLLYHCAVVYSTEELFYIIFNTYDDDGDGFISFNDIRCVIEAATRYVGDYDVANLEVQRVITDEARRLMAFLDIRKEGLIRMDDMKLITQKYPEILEKMKYLM